MEWIALVALASLIGVCVAAVEVGRTLRAHHFNAPYAWLLRCAPTWLFVLDSPRTTLRNLLLFAWIAAVEVALVSTPVLAAGALGVATQDAALAPFVGVLLSIAVKGGRWSVAPAPSAIAAPGWPARPVFDEDVSRLARLRGAIQGFWCSALGLGLLCSHRHITRTALLVTLERLLARRPGREQIALRFLNSDEFVSRFASQVAYVDQTDAKSVMTSILACFKYDLAAALGRLEAWHHEGPERRKVPLRMRVNRTLRLRVEGSEPRADHRVLDESPLGMRFQEWVLFLDEGARVEISDGTDVAAGRVAHTFEREDGLRYFGVAFDHPLPRSMLRFGTARFWSHHHPELA